MLKGIGDLLWGWHVLGVILLIGIELSFSTGFFQLRGFFTWMKAALRGSEKERGGVSQLQALSAALAGSIGTGNIVGVASAVAVGGPGAIFWMWVSALLGMMTVFGENLLSAKYRGAPGALGYIERAGRFGKKLAAVYAAGCFLSSLGMGNMAQTNAAAAALEEFGIPAAMSAVLLGLLLFFVARGGMKFAVKITERLVPLMTLLFLISSLGVLWVFRENLLSSFSVIFREAFSLRAAGGGGMFLAIKTGVSRGVFTNEAGLGSAAFAYDEVQGKSPVELGCMGIFQVFVDTIVMCTVTGLCILCCRGPALEGAKLTFFAYESALGEWGAKAVSLCTALFAAATPLAWCCYGREGLFYLTKGKGKTVFALLHGAAAALGCLLPLTAVLGIGDAFNGLMAVPNVLSLFYFAGEVPEELKRERKKGKRRRPKRIFSEI